MNIKELDVSLLTNMNISLLYCSCATKNGILLFQVDNNHVNDRAQVGKSVDSSYKTSIGVSLRV